MMALSTRLALPFSLCVFALGCPRIDDGLDRVAPRVVAVTPANPILPVTASLSITLSEAVNPASVDAVIDSDTITIALAKSSVVSDAFITDLNSPPLIESRQNNVVPVTVTVTDANINVTPSAILEPNTAYSLVLSRKVSDLASNPIVDSLGSKAAFRYDFTTDAGAPAVTTTDLGGGLVALNRRRVTVTFNQPVSGVGEDTVSFAPAVDIEAILLDEARRNATVFIAAPASGCQRFAAGTTYTLSVSDGVVADTGQTLQPFSAEFQTSAACDEAPHQLSGAPAAIAGEVNATVRYRTTKPSTTFVRFGVDGGALDCLGLPCPVVGAAARTPDNGTFVHSVLLEGLTVNTTYRAIVSAEDDFGLVATGTLTFLTEPLPKIAVNEVMVDPSGTENQGEYIELANFGAVEIDVTGWRVEVTGSSTCTATLPARIIPPGAFLLVVGNAFVPGTYGLADDNTLARSSSQSVCGSGLVNAGVQVVVMEPSGRPVSSLGKHITLASRDEGRSIERIAPDAPDVAASFCLSRTDSGPSPARQNGIVAQGCQ